ncbi:UDP-N-acetylglucosamine--N-acetylmuramyl-(pentapeptide) pyrophosphoryl-undecaprenol N-acetylglucosamine transferase [Bacillus horti]|uniref:UDP-N-acetylglucosamine--N-acetylmuramyl-(Pentapeptide) pyrophosphoryl-undecaprenol N-acetylglucosamine transferase n=1 Tax=Caldalkalibacillus horti TaxID=77523 RepID=A0ABT9W1B2_9BACI|nr:UDP-N-acetylglucosamine--N-acetylmuramyl-(pentapeptide) pyrophosphoryl-undecaprenol N-acetylglucosamine transferase [Bacillus horti]
MHYIGSEEGIEKQMISAIDGVHYYGIATGKLRRYFDLQNIKDPFKVLKGIFQASKIIRRLKPNVIFSKGGFVSVPVVLGGWMNRVPILIHESDYTPGLANKIALPFVSKVLLTFPETKQFVNEKKAQYIGSVVREELKQGNAHKAQEKLGFSPTKPVLLVMGGSLGARKINETVRSHLETLLERFQIVHLCGKGSVDPSLNMKGYAQFEFLQEELADVLALTDVVISRAGSNSIFEFLALKKPMLLIPLSRKASRGDQILNAKSFAKSGYCHMLEEEDLTDETFLKAVEAVYRDSETFIQTMKKAQVENTTAEVLDIIKQTAK